MSCRVAVIQSYGWRAHSCKDLIKGLVGFCDDVYVLLEEDYTPSNRQMIASTGAVVVDCPVGNADRLGQWFRWVWLDSFLDANPDSTVLMVDDDLRVRPSSFFTSVADRNTYVAAGGSSTDPVFVWCGVGCFHADVMKDFAKSSAFQSSAVAGHTDEIQLNLWLQGKGVKVVVVSSASTRDHRASEDPRALRSKSSHKSIRKRQFEDMLSSSFPNALDVVAEVARREWSVSDRAPMFLRHSISLLERNS